VPAGVQQQVTLVTEKYGGANTALQFSQIPREQSPLMQNAWMSKIGAIAKRPGTIPVTATPLGSPILHLTTYKASPSQSANEDIYAASGTTLYKYDGNETLVPLTMNNPLNQADIYTVGFTNSKLTSRMIIGDGGDLKECDGSVVKNVTPAANDPSPAPKNALSDINAKGHKFLWEYSGHVFSSPGTNEVFYSKRYEYDYWPETQYFQLIADNDYVNGPGIAFDTVCLIPMRRGWCILTGENFDNFDTSKFLNTTRGVVAPRSIQKVTYPNGVQTIVFLSDDEVHEVYLAVVDGGGRIYATRSIMQGQIDFKKVGLTEEEKAAAVGFFDPEQGIYLLSFQRQGVNYTWVYDTRNGQWYPDWLTFSAKSYVMYNNVRYFAGNSGHLHKFDENLYSDWNDKNKTSGTPVHFRRYSPLLRLEFSGYESYWDYYLIESRQWIVPSKLDVIVIFSNSSGAVDDDTNWGNTIAAWDISPWDEAQWANADFTDVVNAPNRRVFKKKAKYVQVLWDNPRDEPVEIYSDKWIGRVSGL